MSDETWLTLDQIGQLADGTLIHVEWSGGNKGTYVLSRSGDAVYAIHPSIAAEGPAAMAHSRGWSDPLSFVGTQHPYTRVRKADIPPSDPPEEQP